MDNLEMVRAALTELGNASAADLSRFVEQKYGVRIDPKFIPVYKASIQDKERLDAARQAARAATQQTAPPSMSEPKQAA